MEEDQNSLSDIIEEVDDLADFTISSITDPTEYTASHDGNIDILPPSPSKRATQLTKTRSNSSFAIPLHRQSSVIVASTGRKIQRSYSTWNSLSSTPKGHNLNTPPTENLTQNPSATASADPSRLGTALNMLFQYLKSLMTKPIIKAAIAYFLASLAVYSPTVSNMLGTSDSKHLTCTVVVYFHPSRTVGSMIQALMFVSYSLCFGIGVSILTFMIISTYIGSSASELTSPNMIKQAAPDSVVCIFLVLFVGSTSLGLISFWKHRVCKQTFNTSSSLAAILIISCLVKVYSRMLDSPNVNPSIPWEKIGSIICCVFCGCFVSVFICFTVWKTWAKKSLIKNIISINSTISESLAILCDTFTTNECVCDEIELDRKKIAGVFKNLKSKLGKLDSVLDETMFECFAFGREREFGLYKDLVDSEKRLVADLGGLRRALAFKWEMIEYYDKIRGSPKCNAADTSKAIQDSSLRRNSKNAESDESIEVDTNAVEKPEELIELFLYNLGPSTKSFVFTMTEILDDDLFEDNSTIKNIVRQYSKSLTLARNLFESHQKKTIDSLYKQDIFVKNLGLDEKINQEEVAATCANFSFSVTQIAGELETLLTILNALLDYEESPVKSFEFLKFWKRNKYPMVDTERNQLILSDIGKRDDDESLRYKIWKFTKFTRGNDFQFGFRVGLGALLLASLAFMDSTRHVFNEWRGEWALVTYCIIMNKSLGGTTMTLKWRFLGTFVGAATAYTVWSVFYPHVIIMAILGFIVSIPCFNIILNWSANNAFGRFILLTYNLTVLYSYTMSLADLPDDGDDWEGGGNPIIWEIAFHRYIGVSLGVFWAVLITTTLLPVTARSRIKRGLSVLWLRMGLIWKCGALTIRKNEYQQDRLDGLRGLNECHLIMNELRTLLKQAPMEVRLKGPFPIEIYTRLMSGTEGILDAYENINSIVDVDPYLSPVESVVLENLREEITELQNRLFLMFYMLASTMKLGLPVANDSASTEHAMAKMLGILGDVRRTVEARKEIGKNAGLENNDFVLFYSYCLVTNSISKELSKLIDEVASLYGKIDEETLQLT